MLLIFSLLGFAIGFIVATLCFRQKCSGVLRIDTSDPNEQPLIFLEVSVDPVIFKKSKYVRFKVNSENYISQK